jgi:serine/threonine protein phosphatase PrpC
MDFDTATDLGGRSVQQDAIAALHLADGIVAAVCDGLGSHHGSEWAAQAAAWAWVVEASRQAQHWAGDRPSARFLTQMADTADTAARLGHLDPIPRDAPKTCIGAVLVTAPAWNEPSEVWAWAVGDVLVEERAETLRRLPPPRRDLGQVTMIGTLKPGEMLILATDGVWSGHPQHERDELEAAAWLAEKARIAFERAKPAPAAEIMAASKAEFGGDEPMWKRDNAAVCVIWREWPAQVVEGDDDIAF